MFIKKGNRSIVLIILLSIVLILICGLFFCLKKDQHRILTKKFYIPIKEEYEILYFENVNGDSSERYCYAKLKINADEINVFLEEMEKSGYSLRPMHEYEFYLQNSKDWMDDEKVEKAFENFTVENFGDRIQMNIFITELIDGYYYVYMSR